MREVVDQLRERVGIRGALMMTADGVLVTSALEPELDAESVAALAATVAARARASAKALGIGDAKRVFLTATFGRMVLIPAADFTLVVVAERGLALDRMLLEIEGPARRIHQLATDW